MEKRKNSLSALKVCRFCLGHDKTLSSIYDRNKKAKNDIPLPLKILSCLSVEVFPSDKMPTFICQRCRFFMDIFHDYKAMCRTADERILQYVHDGTSVETVNWPTSLSKLFHTGSSTKPNVMKTVTEGGTTVQVTSQEITDSEEDEDEENVYNIKIADGSQERPKCIKVVTSKSEDNEKTKSPKEVVSSDEADSEEEEELGEAPEGREGGDRRYPCDQCDCTYPLHQLLMLHKRQKHRARNVACDQCNAKFYTKFDLIVHQVRHSEETPFQCVACDKKFKRLVLLKRHEKTLHSDIPQLACPNCPATFLSLEELETHQSRHAANVERSHSCLLCDKRFLHRHTLRRHIEMVHPEKPGFACEYCPAQFSSANRLGRHLRGEHTGERLFPCKYCDKSFLRSHHYTRHVRSTHRDELRGRGAAGPDTYRCEQCGESFDSQDELIYHSAIHATQDLTCPLCQEKFEDVDAVTAHIKSHVNGIEFMCDLCELVFTSKDKLDNHLTNAHAEELDIDESTEDMEVEEDEDDNGMHVKEEEDHMVVEIKKTDGFMKVLPASESQSNSEEKPDNTNSEESEVEAPYTELPSEPVPAARKDPDPKLDEPPPAPAAKPGPKTDAVEARDSQTASILRKAEEVKRKAQQITTEPPEKKEKVAKVESASDKSLRLLEKELQELKRTNTRNEASKTPVRTMETLRNRRPQQHTSTPKTRADYEKKSLVSAKSPALEKKLPERKVLTKENKEPKDAKETKANNTPAKEDKDKKEEKEKEKKEEKKEEREREKKEEKDKREEKERERKEEKDTPKSVVKNGTSDKSDKTPEESVRRSTRPSKIKDYAKMIRDKAQESEEESDDADDDDEYKEVEKPEIKPKGRRSSIKTPVAKPPPPPPTPTPGARKRGRPRKDQNKETPSKIKKEEQEKEPEDDKEKEGEVKEAEKNEREASNKPEKEKEPETVEKAPAGNDANKSPSSEQKTPSGAGVLVSPTGQTLKKVPIRALPPGIKPLPLPVNARPMGPGELCEMQIGKKVVKVQKIVMTKAEVEAMAKKGLVEMKDGTMVLKQGIKLPTTDAASLKSTLVGDKEAAKESPSKTDKPSLAQSNSSE